MIPEKARAGFYAVLLGICLFGTIRVAVEGLWLLVAIFAGCSVAALLMLWATVRER